MTRLMRDAADAANIPLGGLDIVAGYPNRTPPWTHSDWRQFTGLPWVTIDVHGNDETCDVLDIELYAATAQQAPQWVKNKLAMKPGYPPILYVNRSNMPAVKTACEAANLKLGADWRWWVATLDGTKTLPDMTGVTAVQYTDRKGLYDESEVYDGAWLPVAYGTLVPGGQPAGTALRVLARDRSHTHWTVA